MSKQFSYKAEDIKTFLQSTDTFIISLKDGKVIQHNPKDVNAFRRWLLENNVADASKNLSHTDLFK